LLDKVPEKRINKRVFFGILLSPDKPTGEDHGRLYRNPT
jgi:hypothetical protein